MSAFSKPITSTSRPASLRPFDARRDLSRVADLVELCFADTLDQEGHNYLRQMRSAARNPGYLRWAGLMAESNSMPMSGFVWEEDDRIVGNLTLIPYTALRYAYYLIANVAVHPDYRRQGIARSLTQAAIETARRRGARTAWLHVRLENQAAGNLYRSIGFVERASRTTWQANGPALSESLLAHSVAQPAAAAHGIRIAPRRAADWPAQRYWLKKLYPDYLTWHMPMRNSSFQPGVRGFIYRALNDLRLAHWSGWREGRLGAVVTWQASLGYADHLWLAVDPDGDETLAAPLLLHARKHAPSQRTLSLDYPEGRAVQSIESAGFHKHQTLVWMALDLTR
jgi:ribosomal protein S18 acetylase RimI-like enzyme